MGTNVPRLGGKNRTMRVIARPALIEFCRKHPDSEASIKAWYSEAKKATWRNGNEIKKSYRTASIIANERVVFNIAGNRYRLVVAINYSAKIVYIRFIGTHEEYDLIDVRTI